VRKLKRLNFSADAAKVARNVHENVRRFIITSQRLRPCSPAARPREITLKEARGMDSMLYLIELLRLLLEDTRAYVWKSGRDAQFS
jgi:hypothetical protein